MSRSQAGDRCGFSKQYARARETGYELMADEIVEIADDGTNDWMLRNGPDGATEFAIDHEHVARFRLRLDTRKWLLSKALPKVYGDKVQHANSAGDGNTVIEHTFSWRNDPEPKPE